MKRIIMVALATFTVSSFTALHAQSEEASAPPPSAEVKKERPKFDQTERLQKQLNLSEEQTAQVKELQKWQAEQRQKLGKDATREQGKDLRKQYNEKLNAILTPDQQKELEKIHKEQGQKMREGREHKAKEGQS